MSVHLVYYKDGAKMMRPIATKAEYLALRGSKQQQELVQAVRQGDTTQKNRLTQFNYSCLPNEDGTLKGATTVGNTVGMDIDHINPEELQNLIERILAVKQELGLLMLEKSARGEGLHVVFKRHVDMTNEGNLHWASELLGVEFDKGAKDITRVFYATTGSEEDLLYLDEELFDASPLSSPKGKEEVDDVTKWGGSVKELENTASKKTPLTYRGISYSEIIAKYLELFNDGNEPVEGDRNVKTYELAMCLRSICNYDLNTLMQAIPRYDGFLKMNTSAPCRMRLMNHARV